MAQRFAEAKAGTLLLEVYLEILRPSWSDGLRMTTGCRFEFGWEFLSEQFRGGEDLGSKTTNWGVHAFGRGGAPPALAGFVDIAPSADALG